MDQKVRQLVDTVERYGSQLNQISQQLSTVMNQNLNRMIGDQEGFKEAPQAQSPPSKPKKQQNPKHLDPDQVNYITFPYIEVEFPSFSGKDPDYWALEAEKFCEFYLIPFEEAIRIAGVTFEGEARDWYRVMKRIKSKPWSDWEEFKADLYARFGCQEVKEPEIAMCNLQQTGSVMDYDEKYLRIVNQIEGLPQKFLLKVYVNGLSEDIRDYVMLAKPKDVDAAFRLARDYEWRLGKFHS